ncbi:DNA mismatch repair protein Mlh3 isoform X2 [Antennarius striatus]|uniref:DNA mismatch repair protein Mlh3 isoform X2 n=1 Tax=Antennarius striatus TaxID=241820 RepID=UPI0035B25FE2
MIKCLPKEVQAKLRSGFAVPSLQQCVEELILNSIDAEATCVGVRMDMEAFKVQVIDNGVGMSAEDMGSVGSRYYTSKCGSVEDLDDLRWNGFRGEALASIVSLATLVEISSRTRSSVKTHNKIFKDSKSMDVFEAEMVRPSAGTTVTVCNFFHNMPVRRKRMDAVLEGERIRHRVEAISLMHPSVSFTLKNDCTGAMMVQLPKARNTYHRFVQIHGLGRAQKLGEINYTHKQFEVIGHIGREGHYNNSLQFLYVNKRLLLKTQIHKLLNFLLRRLSSLNPKTVSPDLHSTTRSPKQKRNQELNGVYIINVKCLYSEYDICLEPAKTLIEFKDWDGILLCIEEAVKAFSKRENFEVLVSQDDLDSESPKSFDIHSDEEGHNRGSCVQGIRNISVVDCSIGMKLASDSVYRKRKSSLENEDSVYQESDPTESKEDTDQNQITVDEMIQKISEESRSECRDEPLCDPARPEPTSDSCEEEGAAFSDTEEGSCTLSLARELENENLGCSKEREIFKITASVSNLTSPDNITQQIHPGLNCMEHIFSNNHAKGQQEATARHRKISISDPFIHECLQIPDPVQINKSVATQQILEQKSKERHFSSKRKISLDGSHDIPFQKIYKDLAPVVPSEITRIPTGPKLSLCKEFGSLEKFRRMYGKSDEVKIHTQKLHKMCKTRLQADGSVFNGHNFLISRNDQQRCDVTEKETPQGSLQSSRFTSINSVSAQNRGLKSLAAKLSTLNKRTTDNSKVSPHLSGTSSQQNLFLSRMNNNSKDGNDNTSLCDPAPTPKPLQEEHTGSSDWLHHYDASVGKTVYINKVTGLSRYEDLAAEDTPCTSDVTNMAVSVVSETGLDYRCYPFQGDLVLPFLPRSTKERVTSVGLDDRDDNCESSNSLTSLYSKWKNPVFVHPPTVGLDISGGQADGLTVKIHNVLFPYRFSKAMIHSMKVIHQVDKKFLACLINMRHEEPAAATEAEGNLLVLVDQHAAHERVRLENLVADSFEKDPDAPGERRLCSSVITPPLHISVTEEELRLLRSCQPHLQSLGLELKFSQTAQPQVSVGKVPVCFLEKESNELKRGRPSVIKSVVEEYLQEQIELLRSAGRVKGMLPLTVLKILASLACHGAIKFNDSLTRDECCSLVASLSSCQLPFQCAHGRPSIAPLVDILHLDKDQKELQKPDLEKLRRMYEMSELYKNR